jgi:hypothetical protein
VLRDEAHRAAGGVACANDPVVIAQTFAGFRPDLDLHDALTFVIAGNIDDSSMRPEIHEAASGGAAKSFFRALDHTATATAAVAPPGEIQRRTTVSDFLPRLTDSRSARAIGT